MNKYIVTVMEQWSIDVEVDAVDENDAVNEILNGSGSHMMETLEFQETLDVMELVRFDSAYTFKFSFTYIFYSLLTISDDSLISLVFHP